jgi:hypothetical protein
MQGNENDRCLIRKGGDAYEHSIIRKRQRIKF